MSDDNVEKKSVAVVEYIEGNRKTNTFIRSTGLGITNYGIKKRMEFVFKKGEIVTEERVATLMDKIIEESNTQETVFEISCPRVVSINGMPIKQK